MPKILKESMKVTWDFYLPEGVNNPPPPPPPKKKRKEKQLFFAGWGGLRIFSGTQSPIFCKHFSIVC